MKEERSILSSLMALIILAVLGIFVWSAVIDPGEGIKLTDPNNTENRVAVRYMMKSVLGTEGGYQWGGTAEDTSANLITSIVVDYRLFDTSLEVVILFITVLGFSYVLPKNKRRILRPTGILRAWAPMLMIFGLLLGGYMFINGHLSPGGGFPAGAIIATAVLVGVLADVKIVNKKILKWGEVLSGIGIFAMGSVSYFITGNFFQNFILKDHIGDLFSAGLIPVFYTLIAFKVGSELSHIYFEFYEEMEA